MQEKRPSLKYAKLAALALLALGACNHKQPAQAPTSQTAQEGVVVVGGRLVLPALKGHPAAAYFTLHNQGDTIATLTSVAIDGAAKAEMHQTSGSTMSPIERLDIAPGASVLFAGGGKHVMVFDLSPTIAAGGSVDLTLNFASGRKITAQLHVEAPGGDTGAMANMDHMKM
jgi:copper(I)-binding protein